MPIGPTSGFLDFTNATPRADVIIALSNVGVGTDVPLHALDIRGTANVADIIINNDLTLIGGLTTNTLTINSVSMSTTSNFQQVTNVGNVTTNTVEFTNPTTGLAVTSNAEVGGELSVSGNVTVSQELSVSGNVEVGTANLFVDTTTGNVGVGTTDPTHGRMQIVCSSQSPDGGLTVRGGDYNAGLGAMWVEGDGSGQRFKIQAYRNESTDPPAGVNPSTLDADVFELCLNPKGGNVGIGTTNPTSSLHVYGNILGHPVIKTRTITKGSSLSEETETFTLNADENRIVLNNNQGSVGSTRRYYANFTSGVPTTVGTILHLEINSQRINTDATGRGHQSVIQFNGTAVLDTGYIILSATGGNDSYERQLQRTIILTDDGWKDYSMYPKISSPTTDDALIFSTTRHATATDLGQTELTERMRIDGDGNVGIGAASPSHKLTVRAASGDAEVHIQAQGNGSTGAIIYFNGSATSQRKCAILSSPINSWCRQDLHFCHNTSQNYDDVTIADSKMVITNAGNVGIGTANPYTRLHNYNNKAILTKTNSHNCQTTYKTTAFGTGETKNYYSVTISNGYTQFQVIFNGWARNNSGNGSAYAWRRQYTVWRNLNSNATIVHNSGEDINTSGFSFSTSLSGGSTGTQTVYFKVSYPNQSPGATYITTKAEVVSQDASSVNLAASYS